MSQTFAIKVSKLFFYRLISKSVPLYYHILRFAKCGFASRTVHQTRKQNSAPEEV